MKGLVRKWKHITCGCGASFETSRSKNWVSGIYRKPAPGPELRPPLRGTKLWPRRGRARRMPDAQPFDPKWRTVRMWKHITCGCGASFETSRSKNWVSGIYRKPAPGPELRPPLRGTKLWPRRGRARRMPDTQPFDPEWRTTPFKINLKSARRTSN